MTIVILLLAFLIIGCAAYIVLPEVLDHLVDAFDAWGEVFDRIRRRIHR